MVQEFVSLGSTCSVCALLFVYSIWRLAGRGCTCTPGSAPEAIIIIANLYMHVYSTIHDNNAKINLTWTHSSIKCLKSSRSLWNFSWSCSFTLSSLDFNSSASWRVWNTKHIINRIAASQIINTNWVPLHQIQCSPKLPAHSMCTHTIFVIHLWNLNNTMAIIGVHILNWQVFSLATFIEFTKCQINNHVKYPTTVEPLIMDIRNSGHLCLHHLAFALADLPIQLI